MQFFKKYNFYVDLFIILLYAIFMIGGEDACYIERDS